ncbi:TetR/AcrR family transcriptional regulator [Dactylosporangium sp. NPDC050588]|uniref:TetR/AcrR family transcriptional regulator n=1 Tax=Dactylosporangium sp. NPDC050588 TaxID=3157211 RepID=UPI00341146CD
MPPTTPRRADARRNISAILDAAQACLVADPAASMQDVARAAGVGRVTLYAHFGSRAELLDAVFTQVMADAERALAEVDLDGDERRALARLIASSWRIVERSRLLLRAAQLELPADQIREHHRRPLDRVEKLIERGRQAGTFRTDLPVSWMTAVVYNVIHGAADEVTAGRLTLDQAPDVITATLLSAFAPPTPTGRY